MTLHTARNLLLRDRLDWAAPHASWIPNGLYGIWRSLRKN